MLINKNKRTCGLVGFTVPVDFRVKRKKKRKNRHILGPCPRTKKAFGL